MNLLQHLIGGHPVMKLVGYLFTFLVAVNSPDIPADVPWGFPEPPGGQLPWVAPVTTLAASVTATIDRVFAQGLADPRGCQYRQIRVEIGSVWGHKPYPLWTNGWVLPEPRDAGNAEPWAIGWNGLLYPVASLGPMIDLAGDVREMIRRSREDPRHRRDVVEIGTIGSDVVVRTRDYQHRGIREEHSLAPHGLSPLRAFLVFRFGETRLAETMWEEFYRDCDNIREDPFLNVTSEWLWGMWDRAICAHLRADDRIALLTLRQLLPLIPLCEGGWAGCRLPSYRYGDFKNPRFFFFAKDCPKLLQDQERRLWERTVERAAKNRLGWSPFEPAGYSAMTATAARAIEYIRSLENVGISQNGQPGWLEFDHSASVRELIDLGEDAVDPLINCLEFDPRLTRTVSFGRDFHPHRDFLEVSALAQYALSRILQTNAMVPRRHKLPTRSEYARAVRAFWETYRGVSIAERCYRILADDAAGFEQWAECAANLTSENDEELSPKPFGWQTVPAPRKGPPPPLVGEPLRAMKNPSIAELLERRCRYLLAIKGNSRNDHHLAMRAEEPFRVLLTSWGKWEPARIVHLIPEFLGGGHPGDPGTIHSERSFPARVDTMFQLGRIARKAGHEETMDWIAAYLSGKPAEPDWVAPVATFFATEHESPAAQRFLEKVLQDSKSPWGTAFRENIHGERQWWSTYLEIFARFLIACLPISRQTLVDERPFGTAEIGWEPGSFGEATMTLKSGITYSTRLWGEDYFWPKYKDVVLFSVGDWLCQWFGDFTKSARFRVFWPKPVKEYAQKRCLDLWFGEE